jgi:hypothetical protein
MKDSSGFRLYLWPSYGTLGFLWIQCPAALANPEGFLCLADKS